MMITKFWLKRKIKVIHDLSLQIYVLKILVDEDLFRFLSLSVCVIRGKKKSLLLHIIICYFYRSRLDYKERKMDICCEPDLWNHMREPENFAWKDVVQLSRALNTCFRHKTKKSCL